MGTLMCSLRRMSPALLPSWQAAAGIHPLQAACLCYPTCINAILPNEVHPQRLEQVLGLLPCNLIKCILNGQSKPEGTNISAMT